MAEPGGGRPAGEGWVGRGRAGFASAGSASARERRNRRPLGSLRPGGVSRDRDGGGGIARGSAPSGDSSETGAGRL